MVVAGLDATSVVVAGPGRAVLVVVVVVVPWRPPLRSRPPSAAAGASDSPARSGWAESPIESPEITFANRPIAAAAATPRTAIAAIAIALLHFIAAST